MGSVYRATDLRTQGTVAVKLAHPHLANEPSFRERLRREARIAASLSSPRVVRVIDFDEHEGVPFLVMEYVAGETLQQILTRQGRLPLSAALSIATEVARALEAAHARGIVHRDLKPQNVKLVDGQVKVLDFGIALLEGLPSLTATGLVMATPEYCAPEQARGFSDVRTDIYALGVMLYRMLSGEVPFQGPTPLAVLYLHATEPLPPLPDDVPRTVRDVVARCLAKDPGERFQIPTALVAALERASAARIDEPDWQTTLALPLAKDPEAAAASADPPALGQPAEVSRADADPRLPVATSAIMVGLLAGGLAWLLGGAIAVATMRIVEPTMEWDGARLTSAVAGGLAGGVMASLALRRPVSRTDWLLLAASAGIGALCASASMEVGTWYLSQMATRVAGLCVGGLVVWLAFRRRVPADFAPQAAVVLIGAAIGLVLVENSFDDIKQTVGALLDGGDDQDLRLAIGTLVGMGIGGLLVAFAAERGKPVLRPKVLPAAAGVAAISWVLGGASGDLLALPFWTLLGVGLVVWLVTGGRAYGMTGSP